MIDLKKVLYSAPCKTAAIILSLITVVAVALSGLGIFVMFEIGGYTRTRHGTQTEILEGLADNETYRISNYCEDGAFTGFKSVQDIYEDTNVRFTVKSMSGEVLGTTFNNEPVRVTVTDDHVTDSYVEVNDENGNTYEKWTEGERVDVTIYILEEMQARDKYYYADKYVGKFWDLRVALFWFAGIGFILILVLWIYLMSVAGRVSPDGELQKGIIDAVPFDVCIALFIGAVFLVIELLFNVFYLDDVFTVILTVVACIIGYVLAVLLLMSFASRIKQRILIKETLIYRVISLLLRGIKWVFLRLFYITRNIPFIWKSVLVTVGTALFILFLTLINGRCYYTEVHFVLWCVGCAIIIPAVLYIAVMLHYLKKGGERIASGDLNAKVNTQYMFGDFKRFGESLNHINDGVRNAVNESMRSERMKTELITNVSHDIKTPLTSIINYVDLIKKQQPENEQTREYIGVLDRQSIRLKKLIEDLVEASKASSGALSVELCPCDVSVLLSQAVGEFDERLRDKNLQVVINKPEFPVTIMADGRRLWSVFDNLLNNICKYALEGTRVYLDLFVSNGGVYVTFRNISKYPLNISGDELMERFVRGDRSRNTEGSGLGLSIAKSLTELQNGSMNISIDGDLFKVVIVFGAVN